MCHFDVLLVCFVLFLRGKERISPGWCEEQVRMLTHFFKDKKFAKISFDLFDLSNERASSYYYFFQAFSR